MYLKLVPTFIYPLHRGVYLSIYSRWEEKLKKKINYKNTNKFFFTYNSGTQNLLSVAIFRVILNVYPLALAIEEKTAIDKMR